MKPTKPLVKHAYYIAATSQPAIFDVIRCEKPRVHPVGAKEMCLTGENEFLCFQMTLEDAVDYRNSEDSVRRWAANAILEQDFTPLVVTF